jgi:hypothetical protein
MYHFLSGYTAKFAGAGIPVTANANQAKGALYVFPLGTEAPTSATSPANSILRAVTRISGFTTCRISKTFGKSKFACMVFIEFLAEPSSRVYRGDSRGVCET